MVRPMPGPEALLPLGQTPLASEDLSGAPNALQFLSFVGLIMMAFPCMTWLEEGASSQGTYRMKSPLLGLITFVPHNSCRCSGHLLFLYLFLK